MRKDRVYLSGELPPIKPTFDHFSFIHQNNLNNLKPKKKVRFLDEVSFAANSHSDQFFVNKNYNIER